MCNVSITDEYGKHKNVIASQEDTVNDILRFLGLNPDTKIVYKNGKILSREKMETHLPQTGIVHLVIRTRTIRV